MNVAILLVTHDNIASNMLRIATSIVNASASNIASIEIPMDASIEEMESEIYKQIDNLDINDGIIIITDMYGGTPCNIVIKTINTEDTQLISGLNLPMLIKLLNYRELPLDELSKKIVSGGKECIAIHGINKK